MISKYSVPTESSTWDPFVMRLAIPTFGGRQNWMRLTLAMLAASRGVWPVGSRVARGVNIPAVHAGPIRLSAYSYSVAALSVNVASLVFIGGALLYF